MDVIKKPGVTQIVTLGLVQILSWGGSFYLMVVMAAPVVAETGWSQQWVYGALSLGILVSGLLAPRCGHLIARTGGRLMLALNGIVMAAGLTLMGFSHHLPVFLLAWVIIGIGMAMGLYDALFATLGTRYGGQARSAITGITLISGFCTSVVWPATALLIHWLNWRGACFAIAPRCCWSASYRPIFMLCLKAILSHPSNVKAHPAQRRICPQSCFTCCAPFSRWPR